MNQEFYDAVEANPVIAAVKNDAGLQEETVCLCSGDACHV